LRQAFEYNIEKSPENQTSAVEAQVQQNTIASAEVVPTTVEVQQPMMVPVQFARGILSQVKVCSDLLPQAQQQQAKPVKVAQQHPVFENTQFSYECQEPLLDHSKEENTNTLNYLLQPGQDDTQTLTQKNDMQ